MIVHDDVTKWKHFPRYWPFVRGTHWSSVNSPHKGQWRGALMFSLICAWINGWVNNSEAGDLRRHSAHYDVIVTVRIQGIKSIDLTKQYTHICNTQKIIVWILPSIITCSTQQDMCSTQWLIIGRWHKRGHLMGHNNIAFVIFIFGSSCRSLLIHGGVVTWYGVGDLGQHWFSLCLVAWQHHAITWTNVDLPSARSSGVHSWVMFTWILKISIPKLCMEFAYLKSQPYLSGKNDYRLSRVRCTWHLSTVATNFV